MKTFDQTLKEIYFARMQQLSTEKVRLEGIVRRAVENRGCLAEEDYHAFLNQPTVTEYAALGTVDSSAA